MIDMQKLIDMLGDASAQTRKGYHLCLGRLIELLESAPEGCAVVADDGNHPGDFDSYRGYYSDLAIEPSDRPITAAALLEKAKAANGSTFTGYKGGDYLMDESTPLWFASYGCCGNAIVGAEARGEKLVLITREVD